jgi:glycosyltransferase involved in cell wall biosynthesis
MQSPIPAAFSDGIGALPPCRLGFVTAFHPGASGRIGAGEAICQDSIRQLLAQGHEIHVLCFAPPWQSANPAVVNACASYITLEQTRWQAFRGIASALLRGALVAPWFYTRVSPRNSSALDRFLAERRIEALWLDFPSTLGFAERARGLPIDYFVHDVVAQRIGRRPWLRAFAAAVAGVEARLLERVRRCVVLAAKDGELLRAAGYYGFVDLVPPTAIRAGVVDDALPIESVTNRFVGHENLVFFGNMARGENHWSLVHFLLFTFPRLRRARPDIQLWVLGLSPRWMLRLIGLAMPGVHVVGAVDDPEPAFRMATLCVAPMRYGAGVKIKVLQMLDAGATVVATPVGAEGIADNPRLVVASEDGFADSVCRLLGDPVRSRKDVP